MRKLLGPTSDETEGRRHVRNEGFRDLYCSLNTVRVIRPFRIIRLVGHVARVGERRGAHGISVGGPDGKRPLGRPARKWGDNNKTDLKEIGWKGVNLIDLAQGSDMSRALVHAATNLRVPHTAGDFLLDERPPATQEELCPTESFRHYLKPYTACLLCCCG